MAKYRSKSQMKQDIPYQAFGVPRMLSVIKHIEELRKIYQASADKFIEGLFHDIDISIDTLPKNTDNR